MKWKTVEPDIKILNSDILLKSYSICTVLSLLKSPINYFVACEEDCWKKIRKHLKSSPNELGGLLIGRIFKMDDAERYLIHMDDIVASKNFENSPVSLKMDPDIWREANALLSKDQAVVGWYHSHPNLGVFFSGTDRQNQKASFSQNFHLGLVYDPVRDETALFKGAESEEISLSQFTVLN